MNAVGTRTRLEFIVPARGLFGYKSEFLTSRFNAIGRTDRVADIDFFKTGKTDYVARFCGFASDAL